VGVVRNNVHACATTRLHKRVALNVFSPDKTDKEGKKKMSHNLVTNNHVQSTEIGASGRLTANVQLRAVTAENNVERVHATARLRLTAA